MRHVGGATQGRIDIARAAAYGPGTMARPGLALGDPAAAHASPRRRAVHPFAVAVWLSVSVAALVSLARGGYPIGPTAPAPTPAEEWSKL